MQAALVRQYPNYRTPKQNCVLTRGIFLLPPTHETGHGCCEQRVSRHAVEQAFPFLLCKLPLRVHRPIRPH